MPSLLRFSRTALVVSRGHHPEHMINMPHKRALCQGFPPGSCLPGAAASSRQLSRESAGGPAASPAAAGHGLDRLANYIFRLGKDPVLEAGEAGDR